MGNDNIPIFEKLIKMPNCSYEKLSESLPLVTLMSVINAFMRTLLIHGDNKSDIILY